MRKENKKLILAAKMGKLKEEILKNIEEC